ncbi:MAG: ribosome-associated protein [Alphaproteobacteria bacterium]
MKKPAPRKKAAVKKSTAKKATSKSRSKSATKKAPAKKSAAKKNIVKKTDVKKKAAVKKATAKKPPAKKSAVKKVPAKKSAVEKSTAVKVSARKTSAKKVPAKKKVAIKKTVPPSKRAPKRPKKRVNDTPRKILALVEKILNEDQAEDIITVDLAGKTSFADYMVIASGRNPRHIGAMANHLREKIKALGVVSPAIEGLTNSDWVLIDGGDVIIHLFRPEVRGLYNLEKMWGIAWREAEDDGAESA